MRSDVRFGFHLFAEKSSNHIGTKSLFIGRLMHLIV